MLIKIKARGYNRATESFVDKWLDAADPEDQEQVKELRKKLWKYMMAEAMHNRSTTFRLVQVLDEDDDADLIDFSSKPKKKTRKVVEDEDDDDE